MAKISTALRDHSGPGEGNDHRHIKGLHILPEMERTSTRDERTSTRDDGGEHYTSKC